MSGLEVGLLLGLVLVTVVTFLLWLSRDRTLARRVGSFPCWLGRGVEGPWSAGTAQYGSAQLYWWRRWSLVPRPKARWDRIGLAMFERHWQDADASSGPRLVVVTCRREHESDLYLRMTVGAYTGLTSWIEATPSRSNSVT